MSSDTAATNPTSLAPKARRTTREARAEELRNKILAAAAQVVGQHGYADASIGRITEAAGIAQGTFYLYFESRQALFDVLLPHVGAGLLAYVRKKVHGAHSFLEVEERGFRAFFEFLRTNPGFVRVLNEAEVAAPVAHAAHMKLLTEHYVQSLQRSVESGEIREFEGKELEALAYVFQSARSYLYLRYVKGSEKTKKLPDWVVETYMKLVRNGLK
ncbi:TetR/AcrR family transcriptional regulator [Cupriavidus sp. 30B13]|uniref:TetR/AcrR family transcriptional regulator n=1 Tax=Cupriavidus sp. 30B13 TaxID=3384241 RepID=UPI003B9147F5